jgi:CheY-like chemotaxis protein
LELAVRAQPDLIITSAVMTGVSGIGLCRAIAAVTEDDLAEVITSLSLA